MDLLWNGGIGTHAKAEDETHEQVGDRANNGVRVNGRDLRCKVIGEGGNLGLTQKGRIEYARLGGTDGNGGKLNTDAIDNSGGVDCSDHEVKIKIAFSGALAAGHITLEKRDQLLVRMTDEVASLVLKDNILQTQAISLAEQQGAVLLESQASPDSQALKKQGLLNRALEFLPTDRQVAELRASGAWPHPPGTGRACSRIPKLRSIPRPDRIPTAGRGLFRRRPCPLFRPMQKDYAAEINTHPLKREIIGTAVTNSLVNRAGLTFFFDIAEDSAKPPREVAAAYTLARDAFALREVWDDIEAQAGVDVATQVDMLTAINRMVERGNPAGAAPFAFADRHRIHHRRPAPRHRGIPPLALRHARAAHPRSPGEKLRAALTAAGVSDTLAQTVASLDMLALACDVIAVARAADHDLASVCLPISRWKTSSASAGCAATRPPFAPHRTGTACLCAPWF